MLIVETPLEVIEALRMFGFSSFRQGQESAIMRVLCGQLRDWLLMAFILARDKMWIRADLNGDKLWIYTAYLWISGHCRVTILGLG